MAFISSLRRNHNHKSEPTVKVDATGGDAVYVAGGYKIHMFLRGGEHEFKINRLPAARLTS